MLIAGRSRPRRLRRRNLLAIAAPSMKTALKAWGAGSNLFYQGVARRTAPMCMGVAAQGDLRLSCHDRPSLPRQQSDLPYWASLLGASV